MRFTAEQKQNAGIRLLAIANSYKEHRPALSDRTALKLAILANPNLGEMYTGCPIRPDGACEVEQFLVNGAPLPVR